MTWKKTELILNKRLNQTGLATQVVAGQLCMKAESLYPGLFRAISVKNSVLHIEISKEKQLDFTLIKGKLINDLNRFAEDKKLPKITRVRLTIPEI